MRTETRPKSLYEQAVAAENLRHASRLKELRAGEKKLALLDSIAGQLEAAGIALYPGDLQMGRNHIYVAAGWGDQRKQKSRSKYPAHLQDGVGRFLTFAHGRF